MSVALQQTELSSSLNTGVGGALAGLLCLHDSYVVVERLRAGLMRAVVQLMYGPSSSVSFRYFTALSRMSFLEERLGGVLYCGDVTRTWYS